MSFALLAVQTLNGVQLGILLFLIAAGLTLTFGVMDFVNLAHGVQYMVGAYLAAMFASWTGGFWGALALTLPTALAFGLALEFLVFRWLYDRDHLSQILATFGVILFLNQGVKTIWGAAPLSVPMPEALSGSIPLMPGLLFPVYRLALIGVGLGTALALYLLINRTRVGMLVRAGATNAAMVSALGVDIRRLFMLVFGFGAMLAGFAGALVAPIVSVEPGMGDNLLILAFVVIVIGGIGSIRGAFLAALMVGLIDTLGRAFGPQLGCALAARSRGGEPDRARAGAPADLYPDGRRAFPTSFRPLPGQAMTAPRPDACGSPLRGARVVPFRRAFRRAGLSALAWRAHAHPRARRAVARFPGRAGRSPFPSATPPTSGSGPMRWYWPRWRGSTISSCRR